MILEDILGDVADWRTFAVFELVTWKQVEMSLCPLCTSAVADAQEHKDWHLRNRR